jgi:hypothetical protein
MLSGLNSDKKFASLGIVMGVRFANFRDAFFLSFWGFLFFFKVFPLSSFSDHCARLQV